MQKTNPYEARKQAAKVLADARERSVQKKLDEMAAAALSTLALSMGTTATLLRGMLQRPLRAIIERAINTGIQIGKAEAAALAQIEEDISQQVRDVARNN